MTNTSKKKLRLDELLLERELVSSLKEAQALIMSGEILVHERPHSKPGELIATSAVIRLRSEPSVYVSRGGLKLAHALKIFQVEVKDRVCLDVGASTGGFTDCLLQHGAQKVFAVDVGYGILDDKLRRDPRVVVLERTNIRHFTPAMMRDAIDVVTIDVSFISVEAVLPVIHTLIDGEAHVITLIKPQFEVEKEEVGEGGIIRDPKLHQKAIDRILGAAKKLKWSVKGTTESPIKGAKGNLEFLAHFVI
ncbi:MAG: TlyA family RNA methyltransferase [Deltaproteobacteria bacterium]|nr:TlyA family RNA methyltransferase [Deltaproteobacteria bacterium]